MPKITKQKALETYSDLSALISGNEEIQGCFDKLPDLFNIPHVLEVGRGVLSITETEQVESEPIVLVCERDEITARSFKIIDPHDVNSGFRGYDLRIHYKTAVGGEFSFQYEEDQLEKLCVRSSQVLSHLFNLQTINTVVNGDASVKLDVTKVRESCPAFRPMASTG